VENEEVRDAAERVVQVLMRDEEGEEKEVAAPGHADDGRIGGGGGDSGRMVHGTKGGEHVDDEDEEIVEIF
jgi:hypothetical protein